MPRPIRTIQKYDIICTKRNKSVQQSHPGNILYENIIQQYTPAYGACTTKEQKYNITDHVRKLLVSSYDCRFIKPIEASAQQQRTSHHQQSYERLSDAKIHGRISHALKLRWKKKSYHQIIKQQEQQQQQVQGQQPHNNNIRSKKDDDNQSLYLASSRNNDNIKDDDDDIKTPFDRSNVPEETFGSAVAPLHIGDVHDPPQGYVDQQPTNDTDDDGKIKSRSCERSNNVITTISPHWTGLEADEIAYQPTTQQERNEVTAEQLTTDHYYNQMSHNFYNFPTSNNDAKPVNVSTYHLNNNNDTNNSIVASGNRNDNYRTTSNNDDSSNATTTTDNEEGSIVLFSKGSPSVSSSVEEIIETELRNDDDKVLRHEFALLMIDLPIRRAPIRTASTIIDTTTSTTTVSSHSSQQLQSRTRVIPSSNYYNNDNNQQQSASHRPVIRSSTYNENSQGNRTKNNKKNTNGTTSMRYRNNSKQQQQNNQSFNNSTTRSHNTNEQDRNSANERLIRQQQQQQQARRYHNIKGNNLRKKNEIDIRRCPECGRIMDDDTSNNHRRYNYEQHRQRSQSTNNEQQRFVIHM